MAFKFFTIPIQDNGSAEAELNAFLRSHRVLAVERRWVEQGGNSFWSLCVDYLESRRADTGFGASQAGKGKVDYREVLSPQDFQVFAKLRELRKEMSQAEAVPVYMVFTNEQLAQMVQGKVRTKERLQKIEGVGESRIDKYGPRVLEFLAKQWNDQHETGGESL